MNSVIDNHQPLKEYELDFIVTVPMSQDEFTDKFLEFIESLGGTCAGGIEEVND